MKKCFLWLVGALMFSAVSAQEEESSISQDSLDMLMQQIEDSMKYETGVIDLYNGLGKLTVPQGFKFLDATQSQYVLEELWGNPKDASVLGMMVPDAFKVFGDGSYSFVISYDEMGYVKDDDAADMDYDDLLKELKNDAKESNKQREQMGLSTYELIGWASKPYYDSKNKVLHWAKEARFADSETNTLNYDVRILGRKGVMSFNAVSSMDQLAAVKKNIPKLLTSFAFSPGNTYQEFDSSTDKIAAWTVGGLVAGKVLAKVGFWALIVKFFKFIAIGIVAVGAFIWKLITGRKKKQQESGGSGALPS